MKKAIIAIVLASALNTFAAYEHSEYYGETHYISVNVDNTANFSATEEAANYVVVGFETAPVVLDVSDAKQPKILFGYQNVDVDGEIASIIHLEGASDIFACDSSEIIDLEFSIN